MTTIDPLEGVIALMSRDPEELTAEDIETVILPYFRTARVRFNSGASKQAGSRKGETKKAKETRKAAENLKATGIDLEDLL